ncbi:protein MMS22-like isoform X1 [Microplitis demolitor]|uniref:protein MMS22-like isoform X1 n=2 Tax=Microplitis demolitor TaxID=69319 RepID=UPI0004CD77BF|nr:protein MMS22-like isoform X1 [Microplitis demolitor]
MEAGKFVTFNCAGKVNLNDSNLSKIAGLMKQQLDDNCNEFKFQVIDDRVLLFDYDLPGASAIFYLKPLIECVEINLRILMRYEKYNARILDQGDDETEKNNLYEIRKSICNLLDYVIRYISSIGAEWINMEMNQLLNFQDVDKILLVIKKFISRLRSSVPASIFHYAVSNIGNQCNQPEFHLYHMHLELRWLIILFTYVRAVKFNAIMDTLVNDFSKTIELVIDDLVYVSLKIFERVNCSDLKFKTPYSCTCARELWLMIQFVIEDHNKFELSTFWDYVNSALDKIQQTVKIELFSVWLIYHLAQLQGYSRDGIFDGPESGRVAANYEKIDRVLRGFSRQPDDVDEELRVVIPVLKKLTTDWWPFKIMIINNLWECFHRRLDQPFLTSQGLWSVSMDRKTPADMLRQVKERIECASKDQAESSYGMFLNFLGHVLKRSHEQAVGGRKSNHWNQVKGRICSKFTRSKVQEFNEAALVNFISLFLTLAVTTADTANVCAIMLDLLPPVHHQQQQEDENLRRRILLSWKGQLCVLLVYMENNLNLQPVADRYIQVVNVICCRHDELARTMMSTFIDTLATLITVSEKLDHGEHNFIGGWIDRYLRECPKNKVPVLLKIIQDILNKLSLIDSKDNNMLAALMVNVVGCVRTMVFSAAGNYYQEIAGLAVGFTVQASRNRETAEANRQEAPSLFIHFTSTLKVKDARIISCYLASVLNNPELEPLREIKNFNLLVTQAWLKCCIHGQDSSAVSEIKTIKRFVVELDDFKNLFNQQDRDKFVENPESLISWTMALANRRRALEQDSEITALDVKTRAVLGNLDKWVLTPIRPDTQDSELSWWIYRCLGTIFLCCGAMLHTKTHASMLLNYINKFVILKNKEDEYLRHLAKKIFSMVVLGLESANAKNDVTLFNLTSELLQTYLPLLVTENPPDKSFRVSESLTRCFTDTAADFCKFIIEKLSTLLKISSDNSLHKYCYLVMALISSLLEISVSQSKKYITEFIVSRCTGHIIEAYIRLHEHHPHKSQTIKFINNVCANYYYKHDSNLRDKLSNTIATTLINYLLSNSLATWEIVQSINTHDLKIKIITEVQQGIVKLQRNCHPQNAKSLRELSIKLTDHVKKINEKI